MLTAAADRPAANGCFSRTLARLMREGVETEPSEHLLGLHLEPLIKASCPNQVPQHPSWNIDQTLWLSRNAGRVLEPWAQTPVADEIQRLTLAYQPTPALGEIIELSREERCVAVAGEAGSGKSALAAALAWPKVAGGLVPAKFVHGVAFIDEAISAYRLAPVLAQQLARSIAGFGKAQEEFKNETPLIEQQKLGPMEKQIIGPLNKLAPAAEIRLVVDGLDRLGTNSHGPVMAALNELAELPLVRLIVTARPDTVLPKGAAVYSLACAPDESVRKYLEKRQIPEAQRAVIANAAEGSWLVVRVLADLLRDRPDAEVHGAGQLALGDAYEELLARCGAASSEPISRTLELLSAAGAEPLLPLSLLCKASETLGGPATPAGVRDHLVRLRGLAVRSSAGTGQEQAGLFHQTLADYVAARAPEVNLAAHRALLAGIEALAPIGAGPPDLGDPVQRYAFERQAEHFWAVEETDKALGSLAARQSPVPRDNLRRWQSWERRLQEKFGRDHPDVLTTRSNIAVWTGECGEAQKALSLFAALLPGQQRVLGCDHPNVLRTRSHIAAWTGRWGDAPKALRLSEALLSDQVPELGCDHPYVLTTRSNIAAWAGRCGDAPRALRLSEALLPDRERVLGRDHPDVLRTRGQIARWTGECGEAPKALSLFKALLADRARVLGRDHPDVLRTRGHIAHWTGECGEAQEALKLFEALLPDRERVLGRDHPDVLRTRSNIASWTGRCGEAQEALKLCEALLPDQERVLGRDHPDVLTTRNNIAACTGRCGEAQEALKLFEALLPDRERVLGRDHPDVLRTRSNIASWTGECGEAQEALTLFKALLPDRERVLGRDHPDTLTTRGWIDYLRRR